MDPHGPDPEAGGTGHPAVADGERHVRLTLARAHVDEARHLIDGVADTCEACGAGLRARTVDDGDGMEHTEHVVDHADDCPARLVELAYRALGWRTSQR